MSLRSRLVLSYIAIVVISLAIVAVVATLVIQGYRDRFVTARLDDMTRPIYVQAVSLARGQTTFNEVWSNIEEQAEKTGVHIYLVDYEGNVVLQALPVGIPRQREIEFSEGSLPEDFTNPYHGTYEARNGRTFIFAAYQVGKLLDPPRQSSVEALVLSVPRSGIMAIWADVIRPFLWAGLVALAISLLLAFLITRSVYKPIRQLTQAVEGIAQGHYDQKVVASGPSEIKGLANAFNKMVQQVNMSQQQLKNFLSDTSHQLRTPLTSIRGFAQALRDGTIKSKDAKQKAVQVIESESKRMIRQVNELLELSRIQSGQLKMIREPIDLSNLLRHCQEIFSLRAEENGIKLRIDVKDLLSIMGDIDRLEQAICNLLDNAIKHTPPGGEVSVISERTDSGYLEIAFVDTGQGISEEQLPNVFERYYQVTDDETGSGLGLTIAREIIRAHGGDISLVSSPGEGTKFTVSLPTAR
jgi:signal transduction histidine kinase